jgi:multidrug efflux pump subunit AcrA (membrane-fusion protein)
VFQAFSRGANGVSTGKRHSEQGAGIGVDHDAACPAYVTQDAETGASYFAVRIAVPNEEVARLKGQTLVPGMPVESFIQTGERTVISYLTSRCAIRSCGRSGKDDPLLSF